MKKVFVLLLTLMVLGSIPSALAGGLGSVEQPVIIGEGKEIMDGVFDEMVTVEDLFSFKLTNYEFKDTFSYYPDNKSELIAYESGEQYQLLRIFGYFLNESLTTYTYDRYITDVKLIYRDKFEFESLNMQTQPNQDESKRFRTAALIPIDPLIEIEPVFVFKVPNIIETSKDPLVLYMTINGVEYAYKIR